MLYVKSKKPITNLKELLEALFSFRYNFMDSVKGESTYSDPECTKTHCNPGKYRSFDDVFELAQTYFPGTSEAELMQALYDFKPVNYSGKTTVLNVLNCDDIRKPTMQYCTDGSVYNGTRDEHMTASSYKWSELLGLIGKKYSDIEDL